MTMITPETIAPRPGLLAQMRDSVQRHKAYRQVYNELSRLDRRELSDIGIAPGDIQDIARQHALTVVPHR
jgi:uncharacterized protein YjiS (DUF1127 family)